MLLFSIIVVLSAHAPPLLDIILHYFTIILLTGRKRTI